MRHIGQRSREPVRTGCSKIMSPHSPELPKNRHDFPANELSQGGWWAPPSAYPPAARLQSTRCNEVEVSALNRPSHSRRSATGSPDSSWLTNLVPGRRDRRRMTTAFIADVRRCADIDQGHSAVWGLFANSYGLQALLAY